jgi:hypothetical protein
VFLRNSISVPLRLPPLLLLCFFSAPRRRRSCRPCAAHRRPRAAQSRATCRLSPVPPFPRLALASPRRATLPGRLLEPLFAAARRHCNPIGATSCSLQTHASFPALPLPSRPRAGTPLLPPRRTAAARAATRAAGVASSCSRAQRSSWP